jgi:glycine/D-amino acid oxidase-like deaminating enzyme
VGKGEEWQKLAKLRGGRDWYGVKGKQTKGVPSDLDWFDADSITGYSEMGTPATTAQVHPYQFTTSMADLAIEAGANVVLGRVTALDYGGTHGIRGVTYEDKETRHIHTLPATDVILAAGPWTSHVFPEAPIEAPIEAQRAHSVVVKADVSPYAIFSEINLSKDFGRTGGGDVKRRRHGLTVSPELYARPDGTVYACGMFSLCF